MGQIILILGGARSGKSRLALSRASEHEQVAFVATAQAGDEEMAARIRLHRKERPRHWQTIECPQAVHEGLQRVRPGTQAVVIDCLALYISNLLLNDESTSNKQEYVVSQIKLLCEACQDIEPTVFIVSNEVGWGVVPDNALSRQFRDLVGQANQMIAAEADEVCLVVAGLSQRIK